MSDILLTALEITAVGMSLVFAVIVFLWGLMALLTYLGNTGRIASPFRKIKINDSTPPSVSDDQRNTRIAAVAAVAVAMALEHQEPREFPLPSTATVSAWQAVARSNILRRGRVR